MNEDFVKQKGALVGSQNGESPLKPKFLGRYGAKYLVEFLLARKQMQIASHKPSPGSLKHS